MEPMLQTQAAKLFCGCRPLVNITYFWTPQWYKASSTTQLFITLNSICTDTYFS